MNKILYDMISNYEPFDEREKVDKEVMLDFIEKNEDVTTRNNKIAHFTTSAWIVNKKRDKVLMIHHNIYNSWAWVGGHADGDDNLERVIKKEIEEETGLVNLKQIKKDVFGINIVTVINHIKRNQVVNSHLHFDVEYLFECDDNVKTRIKEDENSGVSWIEINKINDYVAEEHMKPIYNRLVEKMKKMEGKKL